MRLLHDVRPDARIEGFVIQPRVLRPEAHELVMGVVEDAVFGPVIAFGTGGLASDVISDISYALPPLDLVLANDLIDRTRISRLLDGYSNRPPVDREQIALALVRLSQLAADFPEIGEIVMNPVFADSAGIIAVDTRMTLTSAKPAAPGGNPRFALRPYPSALDREMDIRGRQVRIRPIRAEDEHLYPEFLSKLTPQDMRFRFFGLIAHPSHEFIVRFTQIDYSRAMAFIAIDPESGRMLGVSRLAAEPDNTSAEFAVIVRSDGQRGGIGSTLMRELIAYARAEGIAVLHGEVLSENGPMREMCVKLGFEDRTHPEDTGLRYMVMDLSDPRGPV